MKYLIANWKSHKNIQEVSEWLKTFNSLILENQEVQAAMKNREITVIICPPAPFLALLNEQKKDMPYELGAQDVSSCPQGSYTGEIAAQTLIGLVSYAIIGHSERKQYFGEDEVSITAKTALCSEASITPIVCTRGESDFIPKEVKIVAYEPVEAIGSGKNATYDDVIAMKEKLQLPEGCAYLYGGSVDPENCTDYLKKPGIDGFLVGTASLDAEDFFGIAECMIST